MTFEQTHHLYEIIQEKERLWQALDDAAILFDDDSTAERADKVENDIFNLLEQWYEEVYLEDPDALQLTYPRETNYLCATYCGHVMAYHSEDYVVLSMPTGWGERK